MTGRLRLQVESAFRTSKTGMLEMLPVYVQLVSRTRGHALVVMRAFLIVHQLSLLWQTVIFTLASPLSNHVNVEIGLADSSLDKVLRRSVDDNAWDEESGEVWRGRDRSSRYGRVLLPRETEDCGKARPLRGFPLRGL
jgi:hypothetical protein